jgi:hypothetical protein
VAGGEAAGAGLDDPVAVNKPTVSQPAVSKPTVSQPEPGCGSSTSIGIRVGTLGVGLELSHLLGDHFGLRVGGNYFSQTRAQTEQSITYDATVKLQSFTGLLDWYPSRRGAFHFTAGAVSNPLKVAGVGVPESGASYTINGNDYTSTQVGVFTSSAKYASVLPYVGLGFGTPASKSHGFGVVFDIGAAIGKPTILLNSSNAANVAGVAADIRAEQAKVQDTANTLPVWPVVSLGLTYRF